MPNSVVCFAQQLLGPEGMVADHRCVMQHAEFGVVDVETCIKKKLKSLTCNIYEVFESQIFIGLN
jgi:hypothetical protein